MRFNLFIISIIIICLCSSIKAQQKPVILEIDVNDPVGKMLPIYAFFGYDEPNYTYYENGRKLLAEIADLSPVPVYVRTHNLLTSKEGEPDLKWGFTNVYTEDPKGNPIYDWTILDKILNTQVEHGLIPLVELGFMPKALSTNPEPYKHEWKTTGNIFTGWTYPPKDYKKWAELIYQHLPKAASETDRRIATDFSLGSFGKALEILEDSERKRIFFLPPEMFQAMIEYDYAKLLQQIKSVDKQYYPLLLDHLAIWLRDLALVRENRESRQVLYQAFRDSLIRQSQTIMATHIGPLSARIETAREQIEYHVNPEIATYAMLMDMQEEIHR